MFTYYRILSMGEIMFECPICESRAILTDEDGNAKCAVCNPYKGEKK